MTTENTMTPQEMVKMLMQGIGDAGSMAKGGQWVYPVINRTTGEIQYRSEANEAAVATGIGLFRTAKIESTKTDWKDDFETWYKSAASGCIYAVWLKRGSTCILIGYKRDNKYGAFADIEYRTNVTSLIEPFCSIYNEVFIFK